MPVEPVQAPLLHAPVAQGDGAPHCPFAPQVSTELPTHRCVPDVQPPAPPPLLEPELLPEPELELLPEPELEPPLPELLPASLSFEVKSGVRLPQPVAHPTTLTKAAAELMNLVIRLIVAPPWSLK